MLFLLLACSSPTVTVTTGPVDGLPLASNVDSFATSTLHRSVERCYTEALAADGALAGTVEVKVSGSHGILKVEPGDGPAPLVACARAPLEDTRNQRVLGDGDNAVGAVFRLTFAP